MFSDNDDYSSTWLSSSQIMCRDVTYLLKATLLYLKQLQIVARNLYVQKLLKPFKNILLLKWGLNQ